MTEPPLHGLEVQYATEQKSVPDKQQLSAWVQAGLEGCDPRTELVIRIVDEAESRALNSQYRGRDKPTNVLSFDFEIPAGVNSHHLGDLVICAPVVNREAAEQGKARQAHWAHMVVHGLLHLQGYDHQNDQEASMMESHEISLLKKLGFENPYES